MIRILEAQGTETGALRSQIQRELDVAEEQIQTLQARKSALQSSTPGGSESKFLRPRAIRAVQGLEDLNRGDLYYASDLDEVSRTRVCQLFASLMRVLGQLTSDSEDIQKTSSFSAAMRRISRAQTDTLGFMLSMLRVYPSLRDELEHEIPSLVPMYVLFRLTQTTGPIRPWSAGSYPGPRDATAPIALARGLGEASCASLFKCAATFAEPGTCKRPCAWLRARASAQVCPCVGFMDGAS